MGQLSALFYKNWFLYKQSLLGNILEIIIPIVLISFIVVIRKLDAPITYQEQSFLNNETYSKTILSKTVSTAMLKYSLGHTGNAEISKLLDWFLQAIIWSLLSAKHCPILAITSLFMLVSQRWRTMSGARSTSSLQKFVLE
jgi:uncharacterized membrane protein (DUF373 family)